MCCHRLMVSQGGKGGAVAPRVLGVEAAVLC